MRGWKAWAMAILAAVAAASGLLQLTPSHTVANQAGRVADKAAAVGAAVVVALPDPLIDDSRDGGSK